MGYPFIFNEVYLLKEWVEEAIRSSSVYSSINLEEIAWSKMKKKTDSQLPFPEIIGKLNRLPIVFAHKVVRLLTQNDQDIDRSCFSFPL